MKFVEMLEAAPEVLAGYYNSTDSLFRNAVNMRSKSAGYLQRQMEMCEAAARRRGFRLSAIDSNGNFTKA